MTTGHRLRKILISIIFVILILIGLLLAAPLFVPVELYKDEVITKLEQASGREIEIRGDIGLRFVPRVQLNMGNVHMGNPQGFGTTKEQDMAALEELQLSLELFDLLQGRVTINTLQLVNPVIYLTRNAKGDANWVFTPQDTPPASDRAAPADDEKSNLASKITMPEMRITNGSVVYSATPNAEQISLNKLNARIKLPSLKKPLVIYADTMWNDSLPVKTQIHLDSLQRWMDGKSTDYTFELTADDDLLKLTASGTASPTTEDGKATPQLKGDTRLAISSLKKLSERLGQPMLQTAKGEGKISLRSMFNYQDEQASLLGTTLTVDDMTISGSGSLNLAGVRPLLVADLSTASTLVLDDILPKNEPTIRRDKPSDGAEEPIESAAWSDEPLLADTSVLKTADARLKLAIGGIKADKIEVGAMNLAVNLANGKLTVDVSEFPFYGGKAIAHAVVQTSGKSDLRISKTATLSNADIGKFLQDAYAFDRLAGRGNLKLSFNTQGISTRDFVANLNGNGNFALQNGAIKGFNLAQVVREARTLVQSVENKSITAEMKAEDTSAPQTDFSSFNGSYSIASGILTNPDLQLKAPLLDVTGSGTVNLPQKTVDYRLKPRIVASIEGENRTADAGNGLAIPVRVTGSFDQLKFTPDAQGLIQDVVKDPKGTLKNVEDNVRGLRDEMKSLFKGL